MFLSVYKVLIKCLKVFKSRKWAYGHICCTHGYLFNVSLVEHNPEYDKQVAQRQYMVSDTLALLKHF